MALRCVGNELNKGETVSSSFEDKEAKAMVPWILRVVFEENLMFEIDRTWAWLR